MNVTGYVLAGGKSSRFGSDKARALLHGVPLIVRVADMLRSSCDQVIAVADVGKKYADLGLETIADLQTGKGPLAGLEAALCHRLAQNGKGWILLVSCDMAGLEVAWSEEICYRIADAEAQHAIAIAFRGDFWQPFPAAFHTNLLPTVTRSIADGRASFQRLFSEEAGSTIAVPLPSDWPAMPQVNTQADLAAFEGDSA